MRKLLFFFLLVAPLLAKGDLLDRVRLENALQERLHDTFKLYDDKAQILVRLEIRGYSGGLPGVSGGNAGLINPDRIELADISKVTVDVYSSLDNVPEEAKTALMDAVPIKEKGRIDLTFKKIPALAAAPGKAIDARDISSALDQAVASFSKIFAVLLLIAFVAFLTASWILDSKRLGEFRAQFKLLVEAVGGSEDRTPMAALPAQEKAGPALQATESGEVGMFDHWNTESLREIFADAYWCELDGYAHWLWKNLGTTQRAEVLKELPIAKDYCTFFVEKEPTGYAFHEHPYYMDPLPLSTVSQEDLGNLVKKEIALWQRLSPMRRRKLPLTLDEKIAALQSKPASKSQNFSSIKSALRKLQTNQSIGEITELDEESICKNPDVVPAEMRHHIRSLVWLARRDPEFVKKTLAKYDARSLASAWIGPGEVLKPLESALPEKKLKLVQSYRVKMFPTRDSETYQQLVDEGLRDDAA